MGCGAFLSLEVLGNYYFGFRVAGEPHRFVPELDLVLILLSVEVLRNRRMVALVAVIVGFGAGYLYLSRPWSVIEADPDYRTRAEYTVSEWMTRSLPGARAFVTGTLRLWYNAWHDGEQVGGGSDQGLLNGIIASAQWQVTRDTEVGRDIAWLQALGVDAVAVDQRESGQIYQDFTAPRKFAGRLPILYDDGLGNVVYRVPRRFAAHARIVEKRRMDALSPIPVSNYNGEELGAYVAAVESGPDRAVEMRWEGTEAIRLRATLQSGEALLVQESYDPAWQAFAGGKRLPVRKDVAGFMLVDAPPGPQNVRLAFTAPRETEVGLCITALTVLLVAISSNRHFQGFLDVITTNASALFGRPRRR